MPQTRANGAAIRVIRERSDMSVRDLVAAMAEQNVQIHPDYLRNIELGYKHPSERVLGALARALKCPKVALLADVVDVA